MGTLRRDINSWLSTDVERKSSIQLDGPRIKGVEPMAYVVSNDSTSDITSSIQTLLT